mmetsp:Transcript_105048/g.313822  ORF Transcript_105048/g.313822 Transcript_105048/m.313822 type:complete len:368 (-) Transcript_105048:134-1237(-)
MEALYLEAPAECPADGHVPGAVPSDWVSETGNELVIMTLNLQYFASYPKDEDAARKRLHEATSGPRPPDIICVQEGLASRDALGPVGFDLRVCAGQLGLAQSVHDMVYGDPPTLLGCEEEVHSDLLCNQIYVRRDSGWTMMDKGAMQISSDLCLAGGGGRAEGKLAIRSMVWLKLQRKDSPSAAVYVMCTHLTGGRFEDQFFVQELSQERFNQPDRIINFFNTRPDPSPDDIGILLGDFNATSEYIQNGPMSCYFKSAIAGSKGVQADAVATGVESTLLEDQFKTYMISPFEAIRDKHGWVFAYTQDQVGVTSGFGHLIDHMATSRPLKVVSADLIYLTNQKFGDKPKDTDLPLTDHNSVKVVFSLS